MLGSLFLAIDLSGSDKLGPTDKKRGLLWLINESHQLILRDKQRRRKRLPGYNEDTIKRLVIISLVYYPPQFVNSQPLTKI